MCNNNDSLSQGSASVLAGEVVAVSDEPEAPSPAINRNDGDEFA